MEHQEFSQDEIKKGMDDLLKVLNPPTPKDILKKFAAQAALIVFGLIMSSLVMWWLWNSCLVGAVDGFHNISFTAAMGLMVLFRTFVVRSK